MRHIFFKKLLSIIYIYAYQIYIYNLINNVYTINFLKKTTIKKKIVKANYLIKKLAVYLVC